MEIVKTYDLEKLKDIVLKEIDVALNAGRDHARINLISAKEIEEILAECMVREERLTNMFENIVKESDRNVCVLDENIHPVFVEKEHPETEMIEGEIESYILRLEDKERELEELRRHLEHLKETISDKDKCIFYLEKENKELREKYEALTTVHYVGKEECEEDKEMPSCFGKFDDRCVNCIDGTCIYHEECLEEAQKILNYKSHECYKNEETINV